MSTAGGADLRPHQLGRSRQAARIFQRQRLGVGDDALAQSAQHLAGPAFQEQ